MEVRLCVRQQLGELPLPLKTLGDKTLHGGCTEALGQEAAGQREPCSLDLHLAGSCLFTTPPLFFSYISF